VCSVSGRRYYMLWFAETRCDFRCSTRDARPQRLRNVLTATSTVQLMATENTILRLGPSTRTVTLFGQKIITSMTDGGFGSYRAYPPLPFDARDHLQRLIKYSYGPFAQAKQTTRNTVLSRTSR